MYELELLLFFIIIGVYLHDPRCIAKDAKTKTRRKNKDDVIIDSLFWPVMPFNMVSVKQDSNQQPHVIQSYCVPLPQYDQYHLHDTAVYSMWMHFVDFCIANSESSIVTVRNADMWPCFTAPDNLINTYSNKERLKVFQVLSWCDSKDISREDLLQYSSPSSTWKNTNNAINHNNHNSGNGRGNNNNNQLNKFNSTHRHTAAAGGSSVIKQHQYAAISPTALHHTNSTALHHTNSTTLHHPTYSTTTTDKNYVNVHSNIMTTHFKGTSNPRDYNMSPPPPPTLPPSRIQGGSSINNSVKSLSIAAKVFEPIAPHVRELPQTKMQQHHYQQHSSFRDDEEECSKIDVQQRIVDIIPLDSMSMSVEEKVAVDAFVDVYDDDQYLISHEEDSFDEDDNYDDDASDVEHGCFDDSMHSQPMSMYSTSVLSVSNNTHSSPYELY